MRMMIYSTLSVITAIMNSGCMSHEEAAKHVTITLIQSPEATLLEWHAVTTNSDNHSQRFESPLGSIEFRQTPTKLISTSEQLANNFFSVLKQQTELQIHSEELSLINPADDDLLQLANQDFLHTTYRTRDQNNQRQRIELFLAPIHRNLVTIAVRIGDDVDMKSYSDLQTFLTQQINLLNKKQLN